MTLNQKLSVIFFVSVLARLLFHYLTGYTADDAFITFRYSENIAGGLGFVYNEGERVLGTTTPLFTLLLALTAALRLPTIPTALGISLICSGLTACVIYRFACSLRFTRWSFAPVLCFILWPRSLVTDTCGMETALFTLLVTSAFYFQHKRLEVYAIGMATLATVTRPEGALLLGLLVLLNLIQHRDRWLTYLVVPLIIIGPWLLFAQLYFGSFIPNSAMGKLALYGRWGTMSTWETIVLLMGWHKPQIWIMTLAVVIGAYWLNRKQNFGWLEIIWMLAMIAFLTFSGSRIFFWYIVPIYPVYLLFACATLPFVFDHVRFSARLNTYARSAVFAVMIVMLLWACRTPVEFYGTGQQATKHMHKAVGLYLLQHASRDDVVAAEDIGYMGYYSGLRILDRDGLVSPQAIPYNRTGNYLGFILDFQPDWVVAAVYCEPSKFVTDTAFLARYESRVAYDYAELRYEVFKRKTKDSLDTDLVAP